jgi:hypothetical protein
MINPRISLKIIVAPATGHILEPRRYSWRAIILWIISAAGAALSCYMPRKTKFTAS